MQSNEWNIEIDGGHAERLEIARRVRGFIESTGYHTIPSETMIYDLLGDHPSVVGELVGLVKELAENPDNGFYCSAVESEGPRSTDFIDWHKRAKAALAKATQGEGQDES